MWLQLGAKYVQGHLKVIWAFITGVVSNYVHVITIEGQASSRSPGQLLLNWPHMRDPPGYIALIRWFNAHKIVTIKTNNTSGSRTALFTNDLNPVIAKLGETCCSRTALSFFHACNNYTDTSDWHHIFEVLDVPNQKPCVMLHVVHRQEIRPTDIIITRQSLTWDMAQYNYVFHLGLKVPDMIHNIIPPKNFKHIVILVPKAESYFSDIHGEIGCENSV